MYIIDNHITEGKDAVIIVDYDREGGQAPTEIKRDSNSFHLDGLDITVNGVFNDTENTAMAVRFESKANTDKIVTSMKDMIKDYNEIVDLVNKEVSTKKNRNYAPLTEEQRKDMSEKEIEKWEEKAKEGLLFGDSSLNNLMGDLRFVFLNTGKAGSSLKDMGIMVSTDWKENGKVSLDEDKLLAAIKEKPEELKALFVGPMESKANFTSGGVMSRLKGITDKYAATEGASKGILVEWAGSPSSPVSMLQNKLYKQMNEIDGIVENMKRTLKGEEDRYQRQFTALEKVVSQMNVQSSWLSQQFGGQ